MHSAIFCIYICNEQTTSNTAKNESAMSTFMHYIWRNRALPKEQLHTTAGETIQIIEAGKNESSDGNIFHNARLKIGANEWSGNIVLHHKSSDWEKEIHNNGADDYKNVILHITESDDIETMLPHGEYIPQLRITYSEEKAKEYEAAVKGIQRVPCHKTMATMDKVHLHSNLSRLMIERIEEKAKRIEMLYEQCGKRWEETFFKLMARNFGFGVQSSSFEQWAAVLDMQALGKHRDNLQQVEAIFFGQAGLLDEESIPAYYRKEALESNYYKELKREYKFLSQKFNLKSIDAKTWNGNATPHLRIARLAALYNSSRATLSSISACETQKELEEILQSIPQGYWWNHLQFGGTTTCGCRPLRNSQLQIIIINTIVPILYTYGKHRSDSALCNKAESLLHNIASEQNNIIRKWNDVGVNADCAADSQALIQLQKEYCNKNGCSRCRFAYAYLSQY